MLQLGGALLPDLVELYQWLHTHLSHLVTYERATKISIGNVISLTAKRYSQKVCTNLTNLFERMISKYNSYTLSCVNTVTSYNVFLWIHMK